VSFYYNRTPFQKHLHNLAISGFYAPALDAEDHAFLERVRTHGCIDGTICASLYRPAGSVADENRFWSRPSGVLEHGRRVGDRVKERSEQIKERFRLRQVYLEQQAEKYAQQGRDREARAAQRAIDEANREELRAIRAEERAAEQAERAVLQLIRKEEQDLLTAELEAAEKEWQAEQERLAKEAAARIERMKQADIEWERAGELKHKRDRHYVPYWKRLEVEEAEAAAMLEERAKTAALSERLVEAAKKRKEDPEEAKRKRAERLAKQRADRKAKREQRAARNKAWIERQEREEMRTVLLDAESKWKDTGVKPKLRDYKAEAAAIAEVARQPGACPGDTCKATPRCQIGKCNRAAFFEIKRQRQAAQEAATKAAMMRSERKAAGECEPGTCIADRCCPEGVCQRREIEARQAAHSAQYAERGRTVLKRAIMELIRCNSQQRESWSHQSIMTTLNYRDEALVIRCLEELVAEGQLVTRQRVFA
jgi:hypothetical protein